MGSDNAESADGGRRQPTMADIAAHLGVSRQLVSLVLRDAPGASEETRRRVREAARQLGFSPHVGARSLRRARSADLGVIFAPAHSTELEIVEHIYPAAAARGYDVILSAQTATRSTNQAVEELLGHRCAAVIVIGSNLDHAGLRAVSRRSPVPVVDVGYGKRNAYYDVVRSSGDKGIAGVVTYLAELGHERIAFVDPAAMPAAVLRRRGYDQEINRLGLAADVLSPAGDYTRGDYFEEAGSAAARTLLRRATLPSAVVVPNDHAAVGVLQILVRNGVRVPEDISVTGFDDAPIARLSSVDLTTVRQDPELMGVAAVEAAIRRVKEPDLKPGETVVETFLVVRGSTAEPRF
ncbi:LacI family DNA-binding transcriptional regulator [Phytohabitans rumicis]|uniref:LacI family transcriptional regulator n=1 Tax=Phytohabitans rumicis TaxID=1076125 RepID=A0A6V8KS78_9ACTN|nr:LacI family DNA-binding transcriptional regulator [Phytohabitans rumicis]GFJ86704.1 LacI family transcriptional regulator [Phytohabitans rumicis]